LLSFFFTHLGAAQFVFSPQSLALLLLLLLLLNIIKVGVYNRCAFGRAFDRWIVFRRFRRNFRANAAPSAAESSPRF
jgi:hypothetical protein